MSRAEKALREQIADLRALAERYARHFVEFQIDSWTYRREVRSCYQKIDQLEKRLREVI